MSSCVQWERCEWVIQIFSKIKYSVQKSSLFSVQYSVSWEVHEVKIVQRQYHSPFNPHPLTFLSALSPAEISERVAVIQMLFSCQLLSECKSERKKSSKSDRSKRKSRSESFCWWVVQIWHSRWVSYSPASPHSELCLTRSIRKDSVINPRLRTCAARVIAVGLSVCVCPSVCPPLFLVTAATLSVKRGHITSENAWHSLGVWGSIIIQPSSLLAII